MRHLFAAAILFAAAPAFADTTQGTVIAFDRVARVLVLSDNTIWTLSDSTTVTEGLVAGDKVKIEFTTAGENGIGSVQSVERL